MKLHDIGLIIKEGHSLNLFGSSSVLFGGLK